MRTKNSNGNRIDKTEKEINELKKNAQNSQEKFEKHLMVHMKEDLQAERFSGSGKYLYTYQEIADKHDVPKSQVQKVAEENGLTRRKNNLRVV